MNALTVRLATEADLDELLRVFAAARLFMRENGNPTQWGTDRPTREDVLGNVRGRCCYAVERDGRIRGTFALKFGPDPMYASIEGGEWLSDEPYMTIHSLASDGTARGVAGAAFRFAEARPSRFLSGQTDTPDEPVRSLRIDTHRNNRKMQEIIRANGFAYCGIVHMVTDGTERLAFQKAL